MTDRHNTKQTFASCNAHVTKISAIDQDQSSTVPESEKIQLDVETWTQNQKINNVKSLDEIMNEQIEQQNIDVPDDQQEQQDRQFMENQLGRSKSFPERNGRFNPKNSKPGNYYKQHYGGQSSLEPPLPSIIFGKNIQPEGPKREEPSPNNFIQKREDAKMQNHLSCSVSDNLSYPKNRNYRGDEKFKDKFNHDSMDQSQDSKVKFEFGKHVQPEKPIINETNHPSSAEPVRKTNQNHTNNQNSSNQGFPAPNSFIRPEQVEQNQTQKSSSNSENRHTEKRQNPKKPRRAPRSVKTKDENGQVKEFVFNPESA